MNLREFRVPAFCPICDNIMKGSKSNNSYYDYGCCHNCKIAFVEEREEKWKSGWRPTKEQIDDYYKKLQENM